MVSPISNGIGEEDIGGVGTSSTSLKRAGSLAEMNRRVTARDSGSRDQLTWLFNVVYDVDTLFIIAELRYIKLSSCGLLRPFGLLRKQVK